MDKLDQHKKEEKFKYKASASAIARIVEIRSKAREAVAEGERDFEDFGETKTGEALQEILDILERQEGFIRLAESSKHGYRLVDKLQEKAKTYPHFNDPDVVKRIQEAEKELDKEDEKTKKNTWGRSRSRSGSRTRSRSRTRKAKKGSSPSRKGYGFSCYWCGRPGHSYKSCSGFNTAAAAGNVEYDFTSRRFVAKNGKESGSSREKDIDRNGSSRDTYVRRDR